MKNTKIANDQEKFKALKLAEIQMTDKEDYDNCVSDMTRSASLNSEEAKIVASAIRSKYLPNILKESGMNEMIKLDDGLESEDFANEIEEDEDMEMHHFEDDEEDMDMEDEDMSDEDMMDDDDEVEDEDTATFEIEVPADMVDAAKQAIQEALDNLLGEDDTDSDLDNEDMDSDEDMDVDMEDEDMSDDSDTEDEDSEEEMTKSSNRMNTMTRQALAARRAQREEILKKLASEEEKFPASANFKYDTELVKMPGEMDYPTLKLQGENSLRADNPDFADQFVPTNNPSSLQMPDVTKPSKMDGSGDGSLEYVVDWEKFEAPSDDLEANLFEVPTDMPMPHRTTRAASRDEDDEDETVSKKHMVECTSCGYRMSMTDDEMETASCPKCSENSAAETEDHAMEDDDRKATMVDVRNPNLKVQVSSLDTARIKTAYSCSSKLALAGIIETSEVDSYAEQMLNDNLKADAMIRQTKLLLKSAQASTERVAAAAAERMNSVRTASTMGISTSPAFSGSVPVNGAALDIQSALKGTWTMPQIED